MKDFKKGARSSARAGGFRSGPSRPSFGARTGGFAARRGPARTDGPVEMHQATCNKCREMCEVPFRPNGKKPVYCKNCFVRDEAPQTGGFEKRGFSDRGFSAERSSAPSAGDPRIAAIQKELSVVHAKLDRILAGIEESV